MIIDKDKLNIQIDIFEVWKAAGAIGTVLAATGFGKSYIAILAIQDMNKRHPDRTSIIVVPTKYLKIQWENNIKKFNLKNTKVIVINTAIKHNYKCNLLVIDEIHRTGAPSFKNVFNTIKYNFLLGLTATIKRTDDMHKLIETYAPIIYTINIKQARKKNYVSDFIVFSLGLELSISDKARYKAINKTYNTYFATFNHNFITAMTALKNKDLRLELSDYWGITEEKVFGRAVNFIKTMNKRKQFLYNNTTKINAVKQIINKFPKFKIVLFSETTKFADIMTKTIGKEAFSYHSKISDKILKESIVKFYDNKHPYRIISSARALEEGADIEQLTLGIIASGNSIERQMIQRLGRAIRKSTEKEKAIIINLYLKDTQDEIWSKKRLKNIPEVFMIDNINEINYERSTKSIKLFN